MISIRPFEPRDLEGVISLHRECFPAVAQRPLDEVERKYRQLFVDNPFRDPRLPPLVACDPDGNVAGVWHCLIRWWRLRDEKIPARTGTARAVRPALQGQGIYRKLGEAHVERLIVAHGDRSIGFADRLSSVIVARDRKHSEAVTVLDNYGFVWAIPLRRRAARFREFGSALLRRRKLGAGLRRFDRAIGDAMERILIDSRPDLPETPAPRTASLTPQGLHESICSIGEAYALRIDDGVDESQWILDYMEDYPSRGCLHGKVLCAEGGRPIGFYAGYLRTTREYEVVLLAARPQDRLAVLVELLKDAYEQGAVTVVGYASATELRPALECGARVRAGSPISLTTVDQEIKQLFLSHDVLIVGLEGEGWI